jgi:hypothetical protein
MIQQWITADTRMAMNRGKRDPIWPNGEQPIHHDAVNERHEASTSSEIMSQAN